MRWEPVVIGRYGAFDLVIRPARKPPGRLCEGDDELELSLRLIRCLAELKPEPASGSHQAGKDDECEEYLADLHMMLKDTILYSRLL